MRASSPSLDDFKSQPMSRNLAAMDAQHAPRSPDCPISIDFNKLEFLAPGTSGVVYAIDTERVLKEYYDDDGGDVERQAFDRLGSHPNIIAFLGEAGSQSIILERGMPISSMGQTQIVSIGKQMAWIRDAAEGLQHIHQQGIIHADVGCENMVIVKDRLKIIDFEGCSIDGKEATAGYKWYNCRDSRVDTQSDIFAYGCVVYHILAGKLPFSELDASDDRGDLAQRLYAENRFPEVEGLPLGELILGCWSGSFTSMGEVVAALDLTLREQTNTAPLIVRFCSWVFSLFHL